MQNIKEFYILGLPIDVKDVGKAHFIKVKELPEFSIYQNVLLINKDKLIYSCLQDDVNENELDYLRNKLTFYDLIINIPDLKKIYSDLFDFIFKEANIINKINKNNFDDIRKLIMDMNCIKEEKINPNPEIQKWIEKSKKAKSSGEKIEFQDMVSSVAVYMGKTYEEINEMTLYQFYISFSRISAFKNYDTNTLFATVSTKKINIESWCKNIDLFEEEKYGITRSEFNKLKNSVFQR